MTGKRDALRYQPEMRGGTDQDSADRTTKLRFATQQTAAHPGSSLEAVHKRAELKDEMKFLRRELGREGITIVAMSQRVPESEPFEG